MEVELLDDATAFLAAAAEHLAADPVVSTMVATTAARHAADAEETGPEDWWAVLRHDGAVVGAAMRTAHEGPRPAYLLRMPDDAAVLLARTLHERGEAVTAFNGAIDAVRACAGETARLAGGRVEVAMRMRLFELHRLVEPRPVAGALRVVDEAEVDRVEPWFLAFLRDADEQAGRTPGTGGHQYGGRELLRRRLRAGNTYFWTDPAGRPVCLVGFNVPTLGAARIGPVYTPAEERGRGWASAAVAAVSADLLAAGLRPCLATDQANPVSNAVYERLGFEPVVDLVNVVLV